MLKLVKKGNSKAKRPVILPYRSRYVPRPIKNYVNRAIRRGQETKEARFPADLLMETNTSPATATKYVILTNIGQGDTKQTRDGYKLLITRINIRGSLQNNGVKCRGVRLVLLEERSTTQGTLDTTNWTNLTSNSVFANRTLDNQSGDMNSPIQTNLFRVLWDKRVTLDTEVEGAYIFNKWIKINRRFEYPTLGSGTVPIKGDIYFVAHLCELDNTVSATTVQFDVFARVFFKDL